MPKRFFPIAAVSLLICSSPLFAQETLGDVARQTRSTEKSRAQSKRLYTNDDIPSVVFAPATTDEGEASADAEAKPTEGDKKAASKEDGDKAAAEAKQKAADDMRKNIELQKKQIAELEREASLNDRDARLRASAAYADIGQRLRDPVRFAQNMQQSRENSDRFSKQIEDAKQKLAEMEEQARRQGVRPY